MANLLKLTNISKDYGKGDMIVPVLKEIDLTIREGEFCAIMGPSGSGKSTLMNIMGCLDLPTEGQYELIDQDISTMSEVELATIRNEYIGFIFQNFHLLPKLTIRQNIELPLIYAKIPKNIRKQRANEMLSHVGLAHKGNSYPSELSGGQQQRIAIARALVTHPSLILADEPTGALDSETSLQIMDLLKQLNDKGSTIIVITHEIEVAQKCKRVIVIRDGVIEQDRSNDLWKQS